MIEQELLSHCTGCSACKEICKKKCIEMQPNEYGFLYPVLVNEADCSNCGLCQKVCPLFKEKKETSETTIAYAAINQNDEIRLESSSGGVFSEIATLVLGQNGVVYGAAYDINYAVIHRKIDKVEDLKLLRGAKYSQSCLNDTFIGIEKDLKNNKLVLFSGTPCQVAGLKSYLIKNYENLICVDFVCHSVPSPLLWSNYVNYRAQQDNKGKLPTHINLRSKHTGWSNYNYSNLYVYDNDKHYSQVSGQDLFMKLFVGNYINRESCSVCQFKGYKRVSDITLADFWGIWEIDSNMDDNKGTSLILLHSEKGKEVFESIKNNLISKEVSLEDASRYNPSLIKASEKNIHHMEVLSLGKDSQFDKIESMIKPKMKRLILDRVKQKIKKIIKTF